jgi:hypothetical protein
MTTTPTPTDPNNLKPSLWILTLHHELRKPGTMNGIVVSAHDDFQARKMVSGIAGTEGVGVWLDAARTDCQSLMPTSGGVGVILRSNQSPLPSNVSDEDLSETLKNFNDHHFPNRDKRERINKARLRMLLNTRYDKNPLHAQANPAASKMRSLVSPLKRWFDILSQKTLLLQDHEQLDDDLLRHLFVSTIQHLQLGHSLLSERRARTWQPAPTAADTRIPPPREQGSIKVSEDEKPQEEKMIKVWWESEERFAIFSSMAMKVISTAYDLTADQPRWRNRDKSSLDRYLQIAIRLGKMNKHPKFNNPPKWDTLPSAGETFARSLQLALGSFAAYLGTNWSANLSHLLADLEGRLGVKLTYNTTSKS